MIYPLTSPTLLSSIQFAVDQPLFPGKLILGCILVLSIVCWAMIFTKAMTLRKIRFSDMVFTRRLRKSRSTLEVFEEGWRDENSLHHEIYLFGAKETAFQLLGSRDPKPAMQSRIKKADKLSEGQIEAMREAFKRGHISAAARLYEGLPLLKVVAVVVPFLGLIGMTWTLKRGFDSAADFNQIAPWVSAALVFLTFALSVAAPAAVSLILFRANARRREHQLDDFRVEICRLFERSYAAGQSENSEHHEPSMPKAEAETDEPTSSAETRTIPSHSISVKYNKEPEKKQYHSLRQSVDEVENELDSIDFDLESHPIINPIAEQTGKIRSM